MAIQQRILVALDQLTEDEFKRFKWYLRQPNNVEGLKPLTTIAVECADRMDVVDKILHKYDGRESQIMSAVLMKVDREDLAKRFQKADGPGSPEKKDGPGSSEKKDGPGSSEKKDGPGSSEKKGGPGSSEKKGGPGSSEKKDGPGSSEKKGGPGSSEKKGGPGSSEKKDGPGSSEKKDGPGSPEKKDGRGSSEKKGGPGSSEKKDGPGSSEKKDGPGSSEKKGGPGSSEKKGGPGSSEKKDGPGSSEKKDGPGSPEKKDGRGSSEKKNGPGSSEKKDGPGSSEKDGPGSSEKDGPRSSKKRDSPGSTEKKDGPGSSDMKNTSSKTSSTDPDTSSTIEEKVKKENEVEGVHKPVKNSEISPEEKHQKVNELFSRLNLKHHCNDKLTTADFLKILPSIKKPDEITEKDVAHTFLQKLLMLDYRARYIPVAVSNEDKHSATTGVTYDDDTDDIDCDDIFNSNVELRHCVHPMDVQMAVFHCSDSFLRQNMITKLAQCQYALPLLVPDPFTGDIECPLWTFRLLRKAWKVTDESGAITSKNMPICQVVTHMVSFFRLGSDNSVGGDDTLSTSKSQLMNTIINDRHSTFFHRHCPGATKSHCLIDGMAEISWYCPAGKPNDAFSDCVAFCNLHGDAVLHEKQREVLINNASVNVVLVPTLRKGDKGRKILSDLCKSAKHLICLITDRYSATTEIGPGKYKMGLKGRTQSDVATELKITLRKLLSTPHESFQLDTMARVSGIRTDEAEPACQRGKAAAEWILKLLEGKKLTEIKDIFLPCQGKKLLETKDKFLPCQGKMWHDWWKPYRYHLKGDEKSSSQLMKLFIKNLQSLKGDEKCYFLKWIGILLATFSIDDLHQINQEYDAKWRAVLSLKNKRDNQDQLKKKQKDLEEMYKRLNSATFEIVHILREMGEMYEAHASSKKEEKQCKYPKLAAELMIAGHPMELMDGDAAHVPLTWITSVLDEVIRTLGDNRVFVLSVLGIQNSGKSTMLNTMFGLQFAVSAGRCTRGAFMQLVKLSEEKQKDFQFDYVLVVDTEGLCALELAWKNTNNQDHKLATFVIGLGNMTLINIFVDQNTSDMQDILHIAVQAFMRMKQVKKKPNCMFVHQNVTDINAGNKNKEGKRRLQEDLDKMTKLAAKEEVVSAEFFSDIITFDVETDVKYFAQLWEGSPPMAPPNPGYSESIQELKDMILYKAKAYRGMPLSQFKSTIEDLWNALLTENFVFSFKTREFSVYRKLEEEFEKWTFALRQAMMTTENQLHTRIDNGMTINNIQMELVSGMKKTHEEVEQNIKKYFDAGKDKYIMVQWRGQFETKIKEFHDDLVEGSKQKIEGIIQQWNARKKLDDKKTVYKNKLLQESKALASQLKSKAKHEKEIIKAFNALWDVWVTELKADIPSVKQINMREDVDSILMEIGIEYSHVQSRRRCGDYKNLSMIETYYFYIIPKGNMFKGLHQLAILGADLLPYQKAVTFIRKVVDQSVVLIKRNPVSTRGYNSSHLQEVANYVIKQVNEFNKDKHYALKPEFKIDLLLHVFQAAEMIYNDQLTSLEYKKHQYYNAFKSYCGGNSSAAVLGELLCSELKDSATQYVYDKTAIDLAGRMKTNLPPFSGNRVNMERHVLQSLAERGDFDSYMKYIRQPREHTETFIKEKVKEYISTNHGNVRCIMENHVRDVCRLLHQAVHDATEEVLVLTGNIDIWLKKFSTLLKGELRFDTKCYENFNDINQFDFLKEEVMKGLDSMKDLNSLPVNTEDVRVRPDQILIDQWCKCCWEQCPFCGSVCTNTLEDHSPDDHYVHFHRAPGITGWSIRGQPILSLSFCTTQVAGDGTFYPDNRSDESVKYKEYRKGGPKYANWMIRPDESKLPYWKWFVCRFQRELEDHYGKRFEGREEIPKEWRKITRKEAIESLKDM